ncbi:TrkH family potassium uptake protein [Butyricicoccus sp.]|uniref:TrkH family potassium uptake protein n=1 Tax=Butyricicoccus sp. TaxID=2049021 RepID=UPI003F184C83
MNTSIIRYILGHVLRIEALLLLLPCLIAVYFHESQGWYYLFTAALCVVLGMLMTWKKPKSSIFYLKEGCIATAMSWIFLSVFGCLPFCISREIPSFTNALFETISGFTTTGASILDDVEALSHCALFWRSFTHWIGGMGVLVFLLAIIPMSGGSNINLMRAESPGPSVGKLVPKIGATARILYGIYFSLTLLQLLLLYLNGMPLFDAVTTSIGTAGTGGFGIRGDSIAGYSDTLQWIVTVFMILFGINFNFYYYLLFRQFRKALGMQEVRAYLLIILASVGFITLNIRHLAGGLFRALTQAAFQVASIITTTGFATTDFNQWPEASKTILVMLMFVGACAGSTGGGIKVSRFLISIQSVLSELHSYIHPKAITTVKMDKKPIDREVVRATNVYFITFLLVFATSVFVISLEGHDLITNFTAVAATINNIGPGLSQVGPAANFNFFSHFSKYVLMFDMLAGRLEFFPLLILLHPTVWKDFATRKKKRTTL